MINILTVEQIIQSENEFILKNPEIDIMNYAAEKLSKKLYLLLKNKKTLFICGPGKNGLDGKKVYEIFRKKKLDIDIVKVDNKKSLNFLTHNIDLFKNKLNENDIVIDSLFGIGLNRNLNYKFKRIFKLINSSKKKIISIDLPSGIHADTGVVKSIAISSNITLAMGFYKPCHFLYPGKKYCGELNLIKLGLKPNEKRKPRIMLLSKKIIKKKIPYFGMNVHKHQKGHVLIFSGEMLGAARLVALSARKIGAGLSTINIDKKLYNFYPNVEPGTILNFDESINYSNYSCVVIGPGLGKKYKKKKLLKNINNNLPLVIDADGLSMFEKKKDILFKSLKNRNNSILTPHHGEFKRLFNFSSTNKILNSIEASKLTSSVVVYKGNDTVVANTNSDVWICNNARKSLATAGTGDILTGMISGLLAQKSNLVEATLVGVWIHAMLSNNKQSVIAEDFLEDIVRTKQSLNNN